MAARKQEPDEREPRATRVFRRLYFDSSVLIGAGWPVGSAELQTLATLARDVGVELFLPEPVAQELEAHWLREFRKARDRVRGGVREVVKLLESVSERRPALTLPEEVDVLADYRRAVDGLQGKLTMEPSPATARPTAVFFDLAVRHCPPFGVEGRGFQDAVILFSVIDHLRAAAGVVAGLVTGDKMFRHPEAQRLAEREGVVIEVFEDMEPVIGRLTGRLAVTERKRWEEDCRRAETALRAVMPQIQAFITSNLEVPQQEFALVGPIVAFPAVEVRDLSNVRTPLPPERAEGDSVTITFDVEAVLTVFVKRPFFEPWDPFRPSPRVKVGEVAPESAFRLNVRSTGPDLVEERLPRIAEVEVSATFRGGQYTDVTPRSVRLRPLLGLSAALAGPYLPEWVTTPPRSG